MNPFPKTCVAVTFEGKEYYVDAARGVVFGLYRSHRYPERGADNPRRVSNARIAAACLELAKTAR
jgi:hypothetical protein